MTTYFKCKKCGNLSVGPKIEGVEISCGAFTDYETLDIQDALDHGVRPSFEKGLKLGKLKFNSVSTCRGDLEEITEEEADRLAADMAEKFQYKGMREK